MNLRYFSTVAALGGLLAAGCVIRPVATRPGDVTFLWSFQGQGCAMVPSVRNVKIQIGAQRLMNDGVYDCSTNGTAGIVLHDFAAGSYNYTIQGRDYNGTVLYTASGSFTVNGSVTVNADLNPVGVGGAYAYLLWTFPPNATSSNPTCEQAGVTAVNVSIDGAQPMAYRCIDGQTASGTPSPYLAPGNHTIELSAVNDMGYEFYFLRSALPISNTPTAQQYDLNWSVGGAAVRWTLTMSSTTVTCGQAGISTVQVNFQDSNGNLVYGNAGDPQPCMNQGVVYSFLRPGTYRVFLRAQGAGGSIYESSINNPATVTVAAGVFRGPTDGPNVLLSRVQ